MSYRSPEQSSRTLRVVALLALSVVGLVGIVGLHLDQARASHESGTFALYSPLGGADDYVSSPSRYHNDNPDDSGTCPTAKWDHPDFDGPTGQPCRSAVTPDGTAGDWSIDIDAAEDDTVYIEINPQAIDGGSAAGTYRVIAGSVLDFRPGVSCANDQYQYFGIHAYNSSTATWENYAWVVLGHIDSTYADGATVIASTTSHVAQSVGTIAAGSSCWDDHLHMEAYNYSNWSRTYDWDGPQNNSDDAPPDGPCIRTGSQTNLQCNAQIKSTDVLGYVGGTKTSFQEVNNPYFTDF